MVRLGKCLLEMKTNLSHKWPYIRQYPALSRQGFACWGNKKWEPDFTHSQTWSWRTWDKRLAITACPALPIGTTWVRFFPLRNRTTALNAPRIFLEGALCVVRRAACRRFRQRLPAPLVHHSGGVISSPITEHTLSLSLLTYRENGPLFERWWTDVPSTDGRVRCIRPAMRAPATSASIRVGLPQVILELFMSSVDIGVLPYVRASFVVKRR